GSHGRRPPPDVPRPRAALDGRGLTDPSPVFAQKEPSMPPGTAPRAQSAAFIQVYGDLAPEVRKMAVYGPPESGKTTFFASLFGIATGDGVALEFEGTATLDYLKKLWSEYAGPRGFPTATGKSTPACIALTLRQRETAREWRMAAIEYAGELIED